MHMKGKGEAMTDKPKTLDDLISMTYHDSGDGWENWELVRKKDVRSMLMERVKELENTPINKLHSQGVYDIPTIQKELLRIAGKETGK